jgi:hypothetical protein
MKGDESEVQMWVKAEGGVGQNERQAPTVFFCRSTPIFEPRFRSSIHYNPPRA